MHFVNAFPYIEKFNAPQVVALLGKVDSALKSALTAAKRSGLAGFRVWLQQALGGGASAARTSLPSEKLSPPLKCLSQRLLFLGTMANGSRYLPIFPLTMLSTTLINGPLDGRQVMLRCRNWLSMPCLFFV